MLQNVGASETNITSALCCFLSRNSKQQPFAAQGFGFGVAPPALVPSPKFLSTSRVGVPRNRMDACVGIKIWASRSDLSRGDTSQGPMGCSLRVLSLSLAHFAWMSGL